MRRSALLVFLFTISLALSGCAAARQPPASWQTGGMLLDIPDAQWRKGSFVVELGSSGTVAVNHTHLYTIDRSGRIHTLDTWTHEFVPFGVLTADGRLEIGDDDHHGHVSIETAWRHGESGPWLHVSPAGDVIYYDDGAPSRQGKWYGCEVSARAHMACTLVTYLLRMDRWAANKARAMTPTPVLIRP
jgi:hypothetical protein